MVTFINDDGHAHLDWSLGKLALAEGNLYYRHAGSGPIIIALHGIQGTSDAWSEVARSLSENYTVVAPDMRGREPSLIPSARDEYSMDRFASDLEALITETGKPAMLIGWSMGVLVLLEYFRRRQGGYPPSALVLAGGSAYLGQEAHWFGGESPLEVSKEATQRAERLKLSRAASPHAVAASWWHARQSDYRDTLSAISTPTLVLHGTDDDQCPPGHAKLLADKLLNAELEMWTGCGHNPMAHDASRFATSVHAFNQRLDGSRGSAP